MTSAVLRMLCPDDTPQKQGELESRHGEGTARPKSCATTHFIDKEKFRLWQKQKARRNNNPKQKQQTKLFPLWPSCVGVCKQQQHDRRENIYVWTDLICNEHVTGVGTGSKATASHRSVPPFCLCEAFEVRGLWHFVLWHIVKFNNNDNCAASD